MRKISLIIENFGKPLEPFFRIKSNLKYLLSSLTTIMKSQIEVAKTFNVFFSNIVKNLEIQECQCEDNLHSRLSGNPVPQTIMKYSYHSNINIIWPYYERFPSFQFSVVDKNTVLKEMRKLSLKKAIQNTDIPVKVLIENK